MVSTVATGLLLKTGIGLFSGYSWSKWRFDMLDVMFPIAGVAGVFLLPFALAHFPIVEGGKAILAGALIGCLGYDMIKNGLD